MHKKHIQAFLKNTWIPLPPLTHNTSLTVKLTPENGLQQLFEGEQESYPAKLNWTYTNDDSRQNTETTFMRLMEKTTRKEILSDHTHSDQLISIMNSELASLAAILRMESVNLTSEENGNYMGYYYYIYTYNGSTLLLGLSRCQRVEGSYMFHS